MAAIVLIVLVVAMPKEGLAGVRRVIAAVFVVLGAAGLAFGATDDYLQVALLYFAAGILFFAEVVLGGLNPLIPVLWFGGGIAGVFFRQEIAHWASTTRPWILIAGLAAAVVLGVLSVVRPHRIA
ncbi:hypothetical protein GCM10010483_58200 [Actinokineospora diospyrosa]